MPKMACSNSFCFWHKYISFVWLVPILCLLDTSRGIRKKGRRFRHTYYWYGMFTFIICSGHDNKVFLNNSSLLRKAKNLSIGLCTDSLRGDHSLKSRFSLSIYVFFSQYTIRRIRLKYTPIKAILFTFSRYSLVSKTRLWHNTAILTLAA